MSDNKKYYYLKLVENFYERDEMVMLESMPDGYMYSNVLLKLYLRSLKNEGKLLFNDRIPYNSTMLSSITRLPVAVVEKALTIFRELGLIEVLDNGAIYMLDIQNFIGQSSTEADRKRNYRKRIEEEKAKIGQTSGQLSLECPTKSPSGQMSGQTSDKTPPEIEIETKTELDLETELEKDIEIEQHIEKKDVVDNISIFFPDLNEKDIKSITNEFLKVNRDMYYLIEKLLLAYESNGITNITGYIIKAIQEDYPIKFCTSLDILITVWEDELHRKQNDPVVRKRVEYYKYKYEENK